MKSHRKDLSVSEGHAGGEEAHDLRQQKELHCLRLRSIYILNESVLKKKKSNILHNRK